jgi:methylthioribose-1-phosphate isomerase
VVPMGLVTGVVTERGVLSVEELGELRFSGDFP